MKKQNAVQKKNGITKRIRTMEKSCEMLENTIGGLQEELQEAMTELELRLESLEGFVAELQSELRQRARSREANGRPYSH